MAFNQQPDQQQHQQQQAQRHAFQTQDNSQLSSSVSSAYTQLSPSQYNNNATTSSRVKRALEAAARTGGTGQYRQSGLDDSEWILFGAASSTGSLEVEDEDDILSTSQSNQISSSRVQKQNGDQDDEEGSDIEDSIIDSFNNEFLSDNRNSIYSNDDLETRIENWRKEQIQDMLKTLAQTHTDPSSDYSNDTNQELMKSWGIDDGKLKLRSRPTLRKNNRSTSSTNTNSKKRMNNKEFMPYGTDLFQNYNENEVKKIRKILLKLSKEIGNASRNNKRSVSSVKTTTNNTTTTSFHHTYLKNLKEVHNRDTANPSLPLNTATATVQHQNNHNFNHSQRHHNHSGSSTKLLHNPGLEKYFPLFIKDLILENKERCHRAAAAAASAASATAESSSAAAIPKHRSYFWESDLRSADSSILSISTNSLMFRHKFDGFV